MVLRHQSVHWSQLLAVAAAVLQMLPLLLAAQGVVLAAQVLQILISVQGLQGKATTVASLLLGAVLVLVAVAVAAQAQLAVTPPSV
jgi:hypothetical protein